MLLNKPIHALLPVFLAAPLAVPLTHGDLVLGEIGLDDESALLLAAFIEQRGPFSALQVLFEHRALRPESHQALALALSQTGPIMDLKLYGLAQPLRALAKATPFSRGYEASDANFAAELVPLRRRARNEMTSAVDTALGLRDVSSMVSAYLYDDEDEPDLWDRDALTSVVAPSVHLGPFG